MPYCPNCGNPLPDKAKFCMECGRAVARTPAPSPTDFAPYTASQPRSPSPVVTPAAQNTDSAPRRGRTGLMIGLAIAIVVLLAALVVLLVLLIGGKDESSLPSKTETVSIDSTDPIDGPAAKKENSTIAEETTDEAMDETAEEHANSTVEEEALPLYTAQGIEVAEITTLLQAYKAATNAVMEATTDDFAAEWNRGNLYDYDGDGYPELILLYSLDGIALESVIFRRTDDSAEPLCLQKELWAGMAGGAAGSIYSGTLDTGESVIFLESTNWEGETKIGKDYVYSLSGSGIEYLYRLEWYADAEGDLINCWVFDADDELMSRDNAAQFMNIFNAREYCEAAYPSDQYGVALADLFSDEAMEAYFSLE